ncbi:MAG: GNAT family N-acetyltransferase [Bacteroidota bacterium]
MTFEVYSAEEKDKWSGILSRMHAFDFYHTYSYNLYYSDGSCKPVLCYFHSNNVEIVLPIIVRNISGTLYKDVTSAYGYVGPLSSKFPIESEYLEHFLISLDTFFNENNIVSVFSRLHPSLNNDLIISKRGTVIPLSETVFIDLTKNIDEQRSHFKKGVKSDLSKLTKNGYYVMQDSNLTYVHEFISIYNENMKRVGARKGYYFDNKYYDFLFRSDDIDARLYFVLKDGIKIATSIFVFTGKIIQYHLSGTRNEYLKNSPVSLLIDHVRRIGTQMKYDEMHLGGGVGSARDSLFNYKAGFSNCRHHFKVWKYIVDKQKYDELVSLKKDFGDLNYFPLYRSV